MINDIVITEELIEDDFQLVWETAPASTKFTNHSPKEFTENQRIQSIRLQMIQNDANMKRMKEEYEAIALSQELLKLDLVKRTPTVKMMAIPLELIEVLTKKT